jgi:hypothetical protein
MFPTEEQVIHLKEMEKTDYQETKKAQRSLLALAAVPFLLLLCMVVGVVFARSRPPATPIPTSPRIANLPAATPTLPLPAALPSPTPSATATSWPTWTAPAATAHLIPATVPAQSVVTAVPLPTYTPQATHTAAPTYTPAPTWTTQPTYTPAPKELTSAPTLVAPANSADDQVANAALIALASTALLFAVAAVFIGLLAIMNRPPVVQPAPIVIHSTPAAPNTSAPAEVPMTSNGTPLPQAQPLRLRRQTANEQRVRVSDASVERVEPVEPAEPTNTVHPEPIGAGRVGEAEAMLITLPFDASRPPTPAERAYIRLRADELGSMSAACKDVYGSKGGKTYDYVRAAVSEGAQTSVSASQVIIQRRIEL